ncbi:phosphomannomutase [Rhizobium sp. TRM95796]|uniref:phosphomannomutase n=1 Tax=Rhizobium sp. TRM95796 TaxID=2979862 RepID=UPI0021E75001|nr:phosphomannomutase [Rhizobium sp. TRM95796]MCV3768359.1 phosphomannomutase [Rhizobium sp. TRM95796]
MAAAFGTSGLRGPAVDFTPELCIAYISAFLEHVDATTSDKTAYVAADLRESSPRIAGQCLAAIKAMGWTAVWAGNVPTPAVAAYAMARNAPAIMITGSHIPEAYNGIKFYRPDGEFLKEDEAPVRDRAEAIMAEGRSIEPEAPGEAFDAVAEDYIARYAKSFGAEALSGLKIGVDLHSAVGRDLTVSILEKLGAEVHAFRRMDHFVAVDTEALDPEDVARARTLIGEHGLDGVISTDGDGDRPLVIDDAGRQINGDVLGVLTAKLIKAKTVVTPLSSTSAVEQSGWFETVDRTRIGSPFVVAGMAKAVSHPVVGFEANGGFLLGDDVTLAGGVLGKLPTRDAILPAVAALVLAKSEGRSLSALVATLPPRFMKADRVKEVAPDKGKAFLKSVETSVDFRAGFDARIATPTEISTLDGVRMAFANGDTVHFRQSGNAPEMRIYVETGSAEATDRLLSELLARLKARF